MAIDTQAKRMSVSGYLNFPMGPYPSGTVTSLERETVAWLYGGIPAGPPHPPPSPPTPVFGRTQKYTRRPVPGEAQALPAWVRTELLNVQRAIPVYGNLLGYSSAIPTMGAYQQGDILFTTVPTAGGFIGWVCVSGGSPGVWKTFGAIHA